MNLDDLGWNGFFRKQLKKLKDSTLMAGRIAAVHKSHFLIFSEVGEHLGKLSGSLGYQLESNHDIPVVGDWVTFTWKEADEYAMIHGRLERQNSLSRAAAGARGTVDETVLREQVIAANIDTVFLVSALDREFNVRRIERYLALAYASNTNPIIVLNKADLCEDLESRRSEVEHVAIGVPIFTISAKKDNALQVLRNYLMPGYTSTFLGSSGVGKSTIVNTLLGEERQRVNDVSDHVGKGQHTTTSREMILLPSGGIVIDTPGMRELQLYDSEEGVEAVFDELETLATHCRFSDCTHQTEPGCAIQKAIADGTLDADRLDSYYKLSREHTYIEEKQFKSSKQMEKEKWKKIKTAARRLKQYE